MSSRRGNEAEVWHFAAISASLRRQLRARWNLETASRKFSKTIPPAASVGSSITGAGQLIVSGATANLAGVVNVRGTNTVSEGTANLTGEYFCTNNTLVISGGGTANFNGTGVVSPAFLNLSSGTVSGSQDVTVNSVMNWTGGTLSGSGRTIIQPSATLNILGSTALSAHTLENGGTVVWTTGNLLIGSGVITNRVGALFDLRSAASLNYTSLTGSRFDNAGTYRKSLNTGLATIFAGMAFNNYGTVEIQTGILAASGGYSSATNALLTCTLAGTNVGTGYGRLQVAGTVTNNGAPGVNLANGFLPTANDTFTVLTAGSRSGTFANFYFPSNAVTMQLSNTANSVIVRVTEVLVLTPPVLTIQTVSSNSVRLIWPTNNPPFRLQSTTNLTTSNWTDVAPLPTLVGTNNVVTNTASGAQRIYRLINP